MTVHNNIDKIFKEGLNNYSEKAPAFIWDNIEKELGQNRVAKKRTVYYSIAASIALLISFGAGYLFTNSDADVQIAELNTTTVIEDNTPKQNENANTIPLPTIKEDNKPQVNVVKNNSKVLKETKLPPKKDENKKTVNPIKKDTKVKKVNSSGTLLPPMYASQSAFNASNSSANTYRESEIEKQENSFNRIESIVSLLETNNTDENLIYEIRQAPMIATNDIEPSEKAVNNWAVGISGTPLLSYRNVQSISNDAMYSSMNNTGLQQNYQNEKPLIAYSTGVNVNYSISSRWNIQSGLYYSETGQVIENINLTQSPWSVYYTGGATEYAVNTSTGNMVVGESTEQLVEYVERTNTFDAAPPTALNQSGEKILEEDLNSTNTDFIQKFEYYEIPLIISYKIINRKLNVRLSGGLSANFLAGNNNYLKEESGKTKIDAEIEGLKSTSYSSIIGCGIEYPIVSRISFSLNPTFRYSLNSINSSGKTYPYSFGVFTGLTYSF